MTATRLGVLHTALQWLPLTQAWLYTQVRNLPADIRWSVACESRVNRLRFPRGQVRARLRSAAAGEDEEWLDQLDRRTGFVAGRLRAARADVVHSHFGNLGWRDLRVVAGHGSPQDPTQGSAGEPPIGHVVSFYGHDVVRLPLQQPKWRPRYQELFRGAHRFLAEGPHMARTLVEQGAPAARVRVHHLGVDVGRIRFRPRTRDPSMPLRVLMAGRFIEKKGFPDGLRALGLAARRHPLRVTVVGDAGGGDRSDEEKAAILQAHRDSGLGDRVRFTGFVSPRRLRAEASRHDLLLAPSRTAADGDTEGGCPMTVPELGASGLAVVASRHADLPMLVRHGETGLSCEPGDVDGFADLVGQVASDPEGARRRARAFRALVEDGFDARRQGEALAAVYRDLAAEVR